jgi:hypothetical protein
MSYESVSGDFSCAGVLRGRLEYPLYGLAVFAACLPHEVPVRCISGIWLWARSIGRLFLNYLNSGCILPALTSIDMLQS